MKNVIFTVGHSTHPQERFMSLLTQHGVTAVCDVRSKPYSRMNPQFNRENLEIALPEQGIAYRFLGRELGARTDDPGCYENGKVQYSRLARTESFQRGLRRVLRGMNDGFSIALVCAEKEPLDCHRTILVARQLAALNVTIHHIHADGGLESHEQALDRLARMLNLPEEDMFHSREQILAEAYNRQEERIAYDSGKTSEAPALTRAAG